MRRAFIAFLICVLATPAWAAISESLIGAATNDTGSSYYVDFTTTADIPVGTLLIPSPTYKSSNGITSCSDRTAGSGGGSAINPTANWHAVSTQVGVGAYTRIFYIQTTVDIPAGSVLECVYGAQTASKTVTWVGVTGLAGATLDTFTSGFSSSPSTGVQSFGPTPSTGGLATANEFVLYSLALQNVVTVTESGDGFSLINYNTTGFGSYVAGQITTSTAAVTATPSLASSPTTLGWMMAAFKGTVAGPVGGTLLMTGVGN